MLRVQTLRSPDPPVLRVLLALLGLLEQRAIRALLEQLALRGPQEQQERLGPLALQEVPGPLVRPAQMALWALQGLLVPRVQLVRLVLILLFRDRLVLRGLRAARVLREVREPRAQLVLPGLLALPVRTARASRFLALIQHMLILLRHIQPVASVTRIS